jgi:hypothetical protein
MRTLYAVVAFTFITLNAFATRQMSDKMIYKNKEHNLTSNPMKRYFEKHPQKNLKLPIMSTALRRGYLATFSIQDKVMTVKDVQTMIDSKHKSKSYEWESVLTKVVPKSEHLKAKWFSGILVLPYGKFVKNVYRGDELIYEHYILLEITKGKVTGERQFDHKGYESFKIKQFESYKKTPEYKKEFDKRAHRWSAEDIDSFLLRYITDFTSKFLDELPERDKR